MGKLSPQIRAALRTLGAITFCEIDYLYDTFKLVSLRHANEFNRKSFSDSWINYV